MEKIICEVVYDTMENWLDGMKDVFEGDEASSAFDLVLDTLRDTKETFMEECEEW